MAKGEGLVNAFTKLYDEFGKPLVKRIMAELGEDATPQQVRQAAKRAAPPSLAVPRPRQKPVVRTDNPGGDWLKYQRQRADENVSKGHTKVSGAVTGYLKKPIELDPRKLEVIPGAMDERRVPGDYQYDALRPLIEAEGFRQDSPILVGVNHLGDPYIIEGNTRAAVARDLGIDRIPAEVRYFAGGEQVGGRMEPSLLEHYMPPSELMLDPRFQKYFEGSQAVDEYGEPLRFYHGTQTHEGSDFGNISAFDRLATTRLLNRKPNMNSVGSWFSDRADREGAGMYAPKDAGVTYPVYLNYKNPWNATFDEFLNRGNELDLGYDAARPRGLFDPEPLREWLKERGHDAIRFPRGEVEGDQNVTVVLEPTQIKSAIGNRGTYDPNNPDITKARGGLAVKKGKR